MITWLQLRLHLDRWRRSVALSAFLLLLFTLLLWVPAWQVRDVPGTTPVEAKELEDQYRSTLAQVIGGLALLFGAYLTYRRISAAERNIEIAEEGQITERFTRAIEQLSNDNLAIRLGGIYGLERIARDSEKDHWTVMEVLCAFLREKTPRKEQQDDGDSPGTTATPPAPDVQAVLDVLARREHQRETRADSNWF